MKRFRFPLQPVAVLRAHREMRAQEAFALAVQAYGKAETEHAEVRQRVTQFERALFAARQQNFSAADQLQALAAYRHECLAENAAEKAMLTARTLMHQRRAEYLEAHRNVEVVAKLEQKARATHRLDCIREEQAGYDDFAVRRSSRRRSTVSV
jgi:flagellar FliJ protein